MAVVGQLKIPENPRISQKRVSSEQSLPGLDGPWVRPPLSRGRDRCLESSTAWGGERPRIRDKRNLARNPEESQGGWECYILLHAGDLLHLERERRCKSNHISKFEIPISYIYWCMWEINQGSEDGIIVASILSAKIREISTVVPEFRAPGPPTA